MKRLAAALGICLGVSAPAFADNLYHNSTWAHVASDQRAHGVGDVLTIVVFQNAEARDAAANTGHRRQSVDGALQAGDHTHESASLSLDGAYAGQGEVTRSQSFITQISVTVTALAENGDLLVAGEQHLSFNGERTTIHVRGRVRPNDIDAANAVLSTRIADAEIDYNGRGFASRNASPGLVQRLFGLLGLAG